MLKQFNKIFVQVGIFSFFVNSLTLVIPLYMLQVFDRVLTSFSKETLAVLTFGALFCLFVMFVLDLLRSRLLSYLSVLMDANLGSQAIERLIMSVSTAQQQVCNQALKDVATLRGFLTGPGVLSFFDVPWGILFILIIYLINSWLGFISFVGAILLFAIAFLNEKLMRFAIKDTAYAARKASRFIDAIGLSAELIKGMGMFEGVHSRWKDLNEKVLLQQKSLSDFTTKINALSKFVRQFIQVLMLCVGAYLVIDQNLTAGIMIASTILLARALAPLEQAITSWRSFVDAKNAYESLSKLLGSPPETFSQTLPRPEGYLTVEQLSLINSSADRMLVNNISFSLVPGEMIAIVGPSAAGKSTLLKLLLGLIKPTRGAVRLDSVDITTWSRQELGQFVGFMPQENKFLSGTVAENIARFTMKDFEKEEVFNAAKWVGAHDLILKLPNGYDTPIGPDAGFQLSGGQAQLIALARAMFGQPRLVLLDEPNTNLDGEGELALLNALRMMKEAKMTVIFITHKPSLLVHVDKVMVLKDGSIDAYGPKEKVLGSLKAAASSPSHSSPVSVNSGG